MKQSISDIAGEWLETIAGAKSSKTHETYKSSYRFFAGVLRAHGIDPDKSDSSALNEKCFAWLIADLHHFEPATEKLRISAIKRFYKFLVAEGRTDINLIRIDILISDRSRKQGIRYPEFNESGIDQLIDLISTMRAPKDKKDALRFYRDRAFILTLADTGFRVHEACNLLRGNLDLTKKKAIIIGKGDKQAVVRFTSRSLAAISYYLRARSELDSATLQPLGTLPIFARHDDGAGKKIKAMTPTTGRNIITERANQILGEYAGGKITPHKFRHYFVTKIYRAHHNLKEAKEFARHSNINITDRYAHMNDTELDRGYERIMEK
jgi:integrase/recombinase XerC